MSKHKKLHLGMIGWGMFLAGALSLSSCVNDEVDSILETTGTAIGFSSSYGKGTWEPDQIRADQDNGVQQVQSRGALTSTVNANWGYKVGAYYHLPNNGSCVDYFDENSTGGYTVSNSSATATTNYYWPPAGEMEFFAVAPIVEGLNVPTAEDITNPTITYTIPENVADQKDIMVAKTANLSCPQSSAVNLQFQHLLAAVQFKAGEMENIEVTGITVSGVKGGKVTMTYDKDNNSWGYSNEKNSVTYSPVPRAATAVADNNEITGNDNSSIMLVMPQELTNSATLAVTYKDISVENSVEETKSVTLTGTWVAGKITNYILTINPAVPFALKVEVQDWEGVTIRNNFSDNVSVGTRIQWTGAGEEEIKFIEYDVDNSGNVVENVVNDATNADACYVKLNNLEGKKFATFNFNIAGPVGGTWHAILVPIQGNPNGFQLSKSQGDVGTPATITITGSNNSNMANMMELRFVVRVGGKILPVDDMTYWGDANTLIGELQNGDNYIIVQDPE